MDCDALVSEARRLLHAGQNTRAAIVFRQIVSLSPDHPDALHGLAQLDYQAGRVERAIEWQQRLVEIRCTAEACFNLGMMGYASGYYAEAEAALRKLIAMRPGEARAFYHLALVRRSRGDHEEAAALCRMAMALEGGFEQAQRLLSELVAAEGPEPDAAPEQG